VQLNFPSERQQRLRNIQIVLLGQEAREPLFTGTIFFGLEDTPLGADHLDLTRGAAETYAPSVIRLSLVRDDGFGLHTVPTGIDFPTNDRGHARFPLDSSTVATDISFSGDISIDAIRITNRVAGFLLSRPTATISKAGTIQTVHLRFVLKRDLFTQTLCALILFSGAVFATLILTTQKPEALGTSVAAFFFSLWSLRGVLASQILTFPTLFDYAIVLLCSLMLAGLLLRVATHPALLGRPPTDTAWLRQICAGLDLFFSYAAGNEERQVAPPTTFVAVAQFANVVPRPFNESLPLWAHFPVSQV
jgi:hypothetical protein